MLATSKGSPQPLENAWARPARFDLSISGSVVQPEWGGSARPGSKPSQVQAPCSLLVWEVPPAKHFLEALGWVLRDSGCWT